MEKAVAITSTESVTNVTSLLNICLLYQIDRQYNQRMSRIINGVFGLAFNDNGQVLLTQRYEPTHPDVHLKWQAPGGGQEFGEHLEDTLKREMNEELGIKDCVILDHRPTFHFNVWDKLGKNPTQVNLFVYVISIGNQQPVISDKESNDLGWFTLDEVKTLDTLSEVVDMVEQGYKVYQSLKH
jgi:8-oxo-dGTP pyrophosphatase MutT (NUDIX family)